MIILGIETSCDETSVGIVDEQHRVLANVVSSQVKMHRKYGGVVPEMASRLHVMDIAPVLRTALEQAGLDWPQIDVVAATQGPGLVGALAVGYMTGKTLALTLQKPFVSVNHMEGHIFANLCEKNEGFAFPTLALIVSGGHTQLVLMKAPLEYQLIGTTIDDAVGEAFDKSARMLGLGYPGGPIIDKLAQTGNRKAFSFPHIQTPNPYDFSFSGLKTAVLRQVQEHNLDKEPKDSPIIADFCASLQFKIITELTKKTFSAAEQLGVKHLLIAGGVSANSYLREAIQERAGQYTVSVPQLKYCTDNGAMIALAGLHRYQAGQVSTLDQAPRSTWSLFIPRA